MSEWTRSSFLCAALIGVVAVLPFFGGSVEDPQKVLNRFATQLKAMDAEGILKAMHPEVVGGKEIASTDIQTFLKRCRAESLALQKVAIDKRFKSEDGKTERFQGTLVFTGPVLAARYPNPSTVTMTLLWVWEDGQWWLERPLSLDFAVVAADPFPTPDQEETALRFEATLDVLKKIGLPGEEDLDLLPAAVSGTASDAYKELEQLYTVERGQRGVDARGRGVQILLRGAMKSQSGLLHIYHGDFKTGPNDARRPVPWDMFRSYVQAAIKQAKFSESRGNVHAAETVYRQIMALGRQFLDEPGGLHFIHWGLTFQKQGAEELARLWAAAKKPERDKALKVANLASRRLDLLQTALGCLDDMTEYRSLKAAMIAAKQTDDKLFMPWGVNTLIILGLKAAPAVSEVIEASAGMVRVVNPGMQAAAVAVLDELASEPGGKLRPFIDGQKQWVEDHAVYGSPPTFR